MKHLVFLFSFVLVIFGCSSNNNGTVTVVPLAPTNLTGSTISTTQINLSWTDNATNEDGYKIERKTGAGSYAVIGSTATNLTTFSDLGLTPNTSYTYRVYAYNSAGNSVQYSNELTIVTQDSIPLWLTNGLVGYWPFNGNANDVSGNGNNGTVNGATLTIDRFGSTSNAYDFNGINNYITIDNYFLNASLAHTISMWWKISDSTKTNQTLFNTNPHTIENCAYHYSSSSSNPPYAISYGMGNGNSGVGSWNVSHPDTSQILGTPPINSNWHQLTWIKDNGAYWKIYMDGRLILNYQSNINCGTINSSANIRFGAENNGFPGGGANLKGSLDDIRIYNRALSASEVAYLAAH